jgi:hypothetical protein
MEFYFLDDEQLALLKQVESFLYGPKIKSGDDIRDHANLLNAVLDRVKVQTIDESVLRRTEHLASMADSDPYIDHVYCKICRECITCNIRPCRDGGPHPTDQLTPGSEPHTIVVRVFFIDKVYDVAWNAATSFLLNGIKKREDGAYLIPGPTTFAHIQPYILPERQGLPRLWQNTGQDP